MQEQACAHPAPPRPALPRSGGVERSVLLWQPKGNVNRKVKRAAAEEGDSGGGRGACSATAAQGLRARVAVLSGRKRDPSSTPAFPAPPPCQVGELAGHTAGVSQLLVCDEQSQVGGPSGSAS